MARQIINPCVTRKKRVMDHGLSKRNLLWFVTHGKIFKCSLIDLGREQ